MLPCIWDNVYPFTMLGLPGELMNREKIINLQRNKSKVTHLHTGMWQYYFRIGIPIQRIKIDKREFSAKLVVFSAATDLKNKIVDNAAIVMLPCIWDNVYPFTMLGLPGELMNREKNDLKRNKSKVTHLWACDNTISKSEFQYRGKNRQKGILGKTCGFLGSNRFRKWNYSNTTQKRTKQVLNRIVIARTGTYRSYLTWILIEHFYQNFHRLLHNI